ncbi:Arm DNA-binding domain-containing protein [Paraburkholderia sp. ZP32-5]|uniref:Arm DNA-binding domain-containing protein n=1 Tax=Paraburkholderia sp. ZP32-5 TaxID=2883245 RepID=UPI001F25FE44|nr:Arm DNA-binding domain-containing protein [Paraburkholderia sp. ZP32-5]
MYFASPNRANALLSSALRRERACLTRIWPNGRKTWLFRYRRPSTDFLSLGPYPEVALVDARKSAAITRSLIRDGANPANIAEPKSLYANAPLKERSVSLQEIGLHSNARNGPTRLAAKRSS